MKKLLVLGSCISSKEIIEYAKSQGVFTIVADPKGLSKRSAKQWSDESWMVDVSDIDTLEKKCIEEEVDGIICGVSEFCIDRALDLCERLNKPFYCTKESMVYSRDKEKFKKAWKALGVPLPEDYYISDKLTDEELANVKFPVVVKPVDCCSNIGISYCYNKEDLREGYKLALSVSKSPKIIVERMLEGDEWYSYYAFVDGKVSMLALNAMYAQPGYPKNVYSIVTTVSDHVKKFCQDINPQIEKALVSIGCKEGIGWVQEMLDKDGNFYVIEMGYRGDGGLIYIPYKEMLGIDCVKLMVDASLGIKNDASVLPMSQSKAYKSIATAYFMWAKKDAKIKEIIGLNEVESWTGITLGQWKDNGDEVHQYSSMATIVFYSNNIDEMVEMIKKINEKVKYIDEDGEDILIHYNQYEYLKNIYDKGLNECM